jgi:dipeptidyl aminopeptidase/acylaminoacyl peptidase
MKFIYLFVVLLVVSAIVYALVTKNNSSSLTTDKQNNSISVQTSTDNDPFMELTIPYLRTRKYESTLGELILYQKQSNYNSYLTSYTSDGLKINGLLTIPNTEGEHPAIVFVHGYIAPSIYKTTERYGDYVDYLARNGFVVFKIDLRGNGDSEGEPGGAYYSSDYVVDTLNAYEALSAASFVDTAKIGLWGHSMAGNVLLRAFAAKPTIPAVVIWAGAGYSYADLQKYGLQDLSYRPPTNNTNQQERRTKLRFLHGEFRENDPFWSQVAATNYLADLKGAIQIHHATDDSVVNIGYSRDLMKLIDNTNVVHELYEYKSGGHNISGTNFSVAMRRTVNFFKKYLPVE